MAEGAVKVAWCVELPNGRSPVQLVHEFADPAGGLGFRDRQARGSSWPERKFQRLAQSDSRPQFHLLPIVERLLEDFGIQLYPLSSDLDQRHFEFDQLFEFSTSQAVRAYCYFPVKIDQAP